MNDFFEKPNKLLKNIKCNLPVLENLANKCDNHLGQEDLIYRFYHQSFRVYQIQNLTGEIYQNLRRISPHDNPDCMNSSFLEIINAGASNRTWKLEDNHNWNGVCRPFLEAFFHSKYFLDMAIKYGKEYDSAPKRISSGWAALLELYNIR